MPTSFVGRDAEAAQKIFDPVLERMIDAVHFYEGTVNRVMGDGIMALFGAPIAHEDHAVRACYSSLRMQETVKRYADEAQRSHGVGVTIRVGLNSGEIVVCAIGNDLHMDYTVVGQTAHLASRLEQMATPGCVLTAVDTFRLAEGYITMKPLGSVPVKGLSDPVQTYEVTGVGEAQTRLQVAARRGLTPFIGREVESTQLHHAQQLAGQGHGQVVAIVGEAGVGKSRLVHEFLHSVIGHDVPFNLLQAICGLTEDELRGLLENLQAAEFLYSTQLFPDLQYTFKHSLTHDVSYSGILRERRREIHVRVVNAIEKLYADRLGEQVERLAYHAVRGELKEKATPYLRQAGAKAAGRSAVSAASVTQPPPRCTCRPARAPVGPLRQTHAGSLFATAIAAREVKTTRP